MKIIVKNASVSFGGNTILKDINFELNEGEKVAIVGRNGSGKTTLLNLITGVVEPDFIEGVQEPTIQFLNAPNIGKLEQLKPTDEEKTLEEEILSVFSNVLKLKEKLQKAEELLADNPTEKNTNRYVELENLYRQNDGYTLLKDYNLAYKQFGFTEEEKTKKIKEFSGGERTKIALIKLLLSKPDVLILDEPTNHLDIKSIEWLEEYLADYKKAVIVVSHDRAFLDRVAKIVYEIEYGKIKKYVGNYTSFIEVKKQNYIKDKKAYERYEEEKKRIQKVVDKFRYKAAKASMAQSKIKQIEKMEVVEDPKKSDDRSFRVNLDLRVESGLEVLTLDKLSYGYTKSLGSVSVRITKGERIGIIGANGTGKSTLLKTIVGDLGPLSGKIKFGQNVEIGYFDQQSAVNKRTNETILESYQKEFPLLSQEECRTDLGGFLFSKEDVFKPLNALSGGELVRLEIAKIFKKKPNVLVLDEPTNHMDILTKERLEDLLMGYKGTIIMVSHDRYFINKLATSLIVIEETGAKVLKDTTYTSYINSFKKKQAPPSEPIIKENKNAEPKPVKENLYKKNKEQTKLKQKLERDINKQEEILAQIEKEYTSPENMSNAELLMSLTIKKEEATKQLDILMEKWLEIME